MSKITVKLLMMMGLCFIIVMSFQSASTGKPLFAKTGETISRQTLTAPAKPGHQVTVANVNISLVEVASGFSQPVQVTHAGDGSDRLFVVEKGGTIQVVQPGATNGTTFLDISSLIRTEGERGLLGLAFHPNYAGNGFFYVNYTDNAANDIDVSNTVIARYQVSANPNVADPGSALTIITINQLVGERNHNGGQLLFGPDGYLYIGMGDGGGGNDPDNNGQDKNTLLGAMLRLDVDQPASGKNYGIPSDNPYVDEADADEIWAIGLRNPWRFSFDRVTGDLYIGDVGQGAWEEIDFQAAGTLGGLNFGWDIREGPCPLGQPMPCSSAPPEFTDPIVFYDRAQGDRSVTGGFVYRGKLYGRLIGRYFYGDFVSGRIWSIKKIGSNSWSGPDEELNETFNISAFGEDEAGELYVVDYSGGRILQLVDADGEFPFDYYLPLIFKG